jgi:hypothetical protein
MPQLGDFRRGERGATPEERIVNGLAALRVIQQRARHQRHRLLRRVILFLIALFL